MSTSTNLGALTTSYSASQGSCTSTAYATNDAGGNGWLVRGADDDSSAPCEPSGYTRDPIYYYSPGVCPLSSDYACWASTTSDGTTETIATCCPSQFTCYPRRGDNIYGCLSEYTTSSALTIASIYYRTLTGSDGSLTHDILTGVKTTTVTSGDIINAYGVIVMRQETDPTWFSSDESTSAATYTGTGATDVTGSAGTSSSSSSTTGGGGASNSDTSSDATSSSLSAGAKAGIAVGVAAAVVAAVFGAIFLFRYFRKTGQARQNGQIPGQQGNLMSDMGSGGPGGPGSQWGGSAGPAPQYWQQPPGSAVGGVSAGSYPHDPKYQAQTWTQDAAVTPVRSEMDSSPTFHELQGSGVNNELQGSQMRLGGGGGRI